MNLLTLLNARNYLPTVLISRRPLIMVACDHEFFQLLDEFAAALASCRQGYLLLRLTWQCETAERVAAMIGQLAGARQRLPQLEIIVLTNSPREQSELTHAGITACYCHQNAFLDERYYPLLPQPEKRYDAIFLGRLFPYRRHLLAGAIPSLRLIGDLAEPGDDYGCRTLKALPQARWNASVSAGRLHREIASAHCGLALSAEEGAMYGSAEYLLCGIPVVNTPNLGGRSEVMPPFAVKTVAPEPEAVAAAVAAWKAHAPEPAEIRKATLARFRPHRERLANLIAQIFHDHGGGEPPQEPFRHQLGLHGRLPAYLRWRCGLPRLKKHL